MQKTALDIIRYITTEVEEKKVPLDVKRREVQMMHFKIRSLLGDISIVQNMGLEFIESLWRIGKTDEIISLHIHDLDEEEQELLMEYLESLETHARHSMRGAFQVRNNPKDKVLKLEVFKELQFDSRVH